MPKKEIILLLVLVLQASISFSQNKLSASVLGDSIDKMIKNRKVDKALSFLEKISVNNYSIENRYRIIDKNFFYCYYLTKDTILSKKYLDKADLYRSKLPNTLKIDLYINKAYYYKSINKLDSSVYFYTKALQHYDSKSVKDLKGESTIYSGLSKIYRLTNNKEKQLFYLKKYLETSEKTNESYRIGAALNNLGVFYDKDKKPLKAIKYFKKSLNYKLRLQTRNKILQNIGSIYLNHLNNIDSSKHYNKLAINKFTSKRTLSFINRDLSIIEQKNKNFQKENFYLKKALKNILLDQFKEQEVTLYKDLSFNYKKLGNYKKSLLYLEKFVILNDSIKNQKSIERLEEIETKYQTEKKEKEIAQQKQQIVESEAKTKQTKNQLIASLVFLVLVGTTALLILKNSRKKRQIVEQEKALEIQKNITLLKDQELNAINAMVEGQEKERKRIAEDLHDNVGSVLATLKLHFENLKLNREKKQFNQEELYEKTENLIDETYAKIRHIAHEKNAGVIANQGLLVAIKIMAEKISSANKTQIEVIDFGLNKRLENTLEISVFRIIQELTTNILKHAEAKNATINISYYENELNIIIEDNGKGFDSSKETTKDGIGLKSIKTRVHHLNGTFDIDSSIGNGTSIIINIPIS